jgi:hypothetical protein
MLAARLEVDVNTDSGLNDYMLGLIVGRVDGIDLESLVLSKFTPQEINKYGITVTVSTA